MQLDRNVNLDGKGKYALVRLREITADDEAYTLLRRLEALGHLDWGERGSDSEFFVMKLKDKYAPAGLKAYGEAAFEDGQQEWGAQVMAMGHRAADHPNQKIPD